MELNNITNTGTWGQQVTRLNDNFNRVALGIDTLQSAYQSLSQSAIEVVDTLPQTGKANKIYRLVGTTSYSDYMYNTDDLNTPILMATYNNAIENEPTPGSNNLVKSGGVAAAIVFDISAYHATGSTLATYSNLSDSLGPDGANVPASVRKGGMSVKFVQSSDNKYVQYRLMATSFSTNKSDWQCADDPLRTVPMSLFSGNNYYDWEGVEIGQYIGFNGKKPITHQGTYYNYHLFLQKGEKVIIKGQGSNGTSLLYVLVSVATGKVTLMAEHACYALVTPVEIEIDEDCELYGTSLSVSNCYIYIGKVASENAVIPGNRIIGSLDDNSIPYNKLDFPTKMGNRFFETELDKYIKELYIEGLDKSVDYCMRTLQWDGSGVQLNIGDSTKSVIEITTHNQLENTNVCKGVSGEITAYVIFANIDKIKENGSPLIFANTN